MRDTIPAERRHEGGVDRELCLDHFDATLINVVWESNVEVPHEDVRSRLTSHFGCDGHTSMSAKWGAMGAVSDGGEGLERPERRNERGEE